MLPFELEPMMRPPSQCSSLEKQMLKLAYEELVNTLSAHAKSQAELETILAEELFEYEDFS